MRKMAAEQGIHLATVTGTGVGGRIRKQGVLDRAAPGLLSPLQGGNENGFRHRRRS